MHVSPSVHGSILLLVPHKRWEFVHTVSLGWVGGVVYWRVKLSWVGMDSVLIWSDQVGIGFLSARSGLGPSHSCNSG